ncbi:MAG: hypothetical protein EON56_04855 [Alphaproteobacteria bacterium]|nr:MAG: hypothetical protein EON56_04855 [Alphaproteobacteria bacterium]
MNITLTLIKTAGMALAAVLLVACGDSKISAVKETRLANAEFTIEESMDKAKDCKDAEWSSELVNDVTIVTHTCTVPMGEKELKRYKDAALDRLKSDGERKQATYDRVVAESVERLRSVTESHHHYVQATTGELQKLALQNTDEPEFVANPLLSPLMQERAVHADERRKAARLEALALAQQELGELQVNGPQKIANYQEALDGLLSWKEKYPGAVADLTQGTIPMIDEHFSKERSVQVVTRFQYRVDQPAVPLDSVVIVDGKRSVGSDPAYVNLSRSMTRVYDYVGGVVSFNASVFDDEFPLEFAFSEKISEPNGFKVKGASNAAK